MNRSIVRLLLERLAAEQRHVVSDWRAMLLLRSLSEDLPALRPDALPASRAEARRLLRRMVTAGDLRPIDGLVGVYDVTAPYADRGYVDELEVLMEVHPFAAASHHTAFAFHGLTDEQPKVLHASVPVFDTAALPPPDLSAEEWALHTLAPARFPEAISGTSVRWHRVQPSRFAGVREYRPEGWPLRVTSPERTLLDGLATPEACGGFGSVLHGWSRYRDRLDLAALVRLVDLLDVGVLRQRVGFVLETLGLSHDALAGWRTNSRRGGSSRLNGSAPYAPTFDPVWNLSLNAPTDALREEYAP